MASLGGADLMQTTQMEQRHLREAVAASRRWYDDIFALHGIATESDGALWWATGAPPRWHSAVKTLAPTADPSEALRRMERHPHGSVADSFGLLDLTAHGFALLLSATWLHHGGVASESPPSGWMQVRDAGLMARWNELHDTVGVLPIDLGAHPRFTVLARRDGDELTGGCILHDAGPVVGLSNTWAAEGVTLDPRELLELAALAHPGRAVVDYAWGAELESMLEAGFAPVGPHHVWAR